MRRSCHAFCGSSWLPPDIQPEGAGGPTISVVVPVRNRADLVCQTLDSILTQEWPRLEVIVVDDGSTDDTPAVVRSAYRDRVKLLVQPNAGPSAARNAGLACASGEFLMTFDSDDLMLPGSLPALAQALAADPSADAAYGSYVHERRDGRRTHLEPAGWPAGDLVPLIPTGLKIRHSSILFRRKLLPADGALFDPLTFKREDTFAVYRLIAAGRFVPVRVPVTLVQAVAGKGRQRRAHAALLADGAGSVERLLRDPVVGGRLQAIAPYLLGTHYRRLAKAAYKKRDWAQFGRYYARAKEYSPPSMRTMPWLKRYLVSQLMGPFSRHAARSSSSSSSSSSSAVD
jgi:glycosyltransferase involved in cell wall biosynthesis